MPKKDAHPTQSFAQLVSQANRDALKPYIDEQVQIKSSQLARQHLSAISEIIAPMAALTRLLVKKGIVTNEELTEARFDTEDEAWNLKATTEGAAEGDYVRIQFQTREDKEGSEYGEEDHLSVRRLGNAQAQQLPTDWEAGMIGMKAGETREIPFTMDSQQLNPETKKLDAVTLKYIAKTTVRRVSQYPARPKPPEPVAPPAAPTEGENNG